MSAQTFSLGNITASNLKQTLNFDKRIELFQRNCTRRRGPQIEKMNRPRLSAKARDKGIGALDTFAFARSFGARGNFLFQFLFGNFTRADFAGGDAEKSFGK